MEDTDLDRKEEIYEALNGHLQEEVFIGNRKVEDAFQEFGPCDILYRQIYIAKMRLNRKMHTVDDADVELIIQNMFSIAKILEMKMFDYGQQAAQKGNEEETEFCTKRSEWSGDGKIVFIENKGGM